MGSILNRFNGTNVITDDDLVREKIAVPWISSMHRGFRSSTVHEGTMAAFHRAWESGANCLEIDARLSSDGVYVVSHDSYVTVDGVQYTIANETAETLTNLVLSVDPKYGRCCISTLEDVLKFCCFSGMWANIDTKLVNPETLAKLVVDCGMSGRAIYMGNLVPSVDYMVRYLAVDPLACFAMEYSKLESLTAREELSDLNTRQRIYIGVGTALDAADDGGVSIVETIKAAGFKFKTGVNKNNYVARMSLIPDFIEFESWINCEELNNLFLDSLDFNIYNKD